MTIYKARIITSTMGESSAPGIMQCTIPSTQFDISPTDLGLEDPIVPIIYTSPYASHGEGGFIGIPPDGTNILVEQIGKSFYYLTSIVGPDPDDVNEVDEGTPTNIIGSFGCETEHDPIYNKSDNFPDSVILRHPKGHSLIMRDDVPMENEEVQPDRKVHNSKIELKSAGGKIVSLDDSNAIDALRVGVDKQGRDSNQFDGIIIGQKAGITGPRCIKTQAENNITTTSESGDIINRVVAGNKYEVENISIATEGMIPLLGLPVKPQVNMGTEFGDINLVAGNNEAVALAGPPKAQLGGSKVIIEALGIDRVAVWDEDISPPMSPVPQIVIKSGPISPPIIRITSDGDIEIFANGLLPPGKLNIKAVGDINMESTTGNINMNALAGKVNIVGSLGVDIAGATVNLNPIVPPVIPPMILVSPLPTSSYVPGASLRGYVPFGWMMPFSPPI